MDFCHNYLLEITEVFVGLITLVFKYPRLTFTTALMVPDKLLQKVVVPHNNIASLSIKNQLTFFEASQPFLFVFRYIL